MLPLFADSRFVGAHSVRPFLFSVYDARKGSVLTSNLQSIMTPDVV